MNLFNNTVWPPTGEECFETLFASADVTIERICSNTLREGEWYDQERDEWVVLVQGDATLAFDSGITKPLTKGDYLFIKAHERHRVLSTSEDALWLAVHMKKAAIT